MPASKQIAVLSVRMPASELRRIKSVAARRGVTLQEAVHEALDAWTLRTRSTVMLPPLDSLEGSLADVDIAKIMREDRRSELSKDRSRLR
jgi:hypothetical protein